MYMFFKCFFFFHNIKGVSAIYTETEDNVLGKRKKIKQNMKMNKQQQKGVQMFFGIFLYFLVGNFFFAVHIKNQKSK